MTSNPEKSQAQRPVRFFISYKRDAEPDQVIAGRICDTLKTRGHTVFIDQTLTVGEDWAREIEKSVRKSDYLIVFLTAASIQSEMVKGEIEIARDEAGKSDGKPRILPVRLAYVGPLPYPLNAWLDPIQYALWRGESDTARLLDELVRAAGGVPLSRAGVVGSPATSRDGPPLYSAPLPPPGGSLDAEDPWYIHRNTDRTGLSVIDHQGITLTIKGSRQMGKSSLLIRILAAAINRGKRCVLVDFQLFGRDALRQESAFFKHFCGSIANQLEIPNGLEGLGDGSLSLTQNCTRYIERTILSQLDAPVVIAVDEADNIFLSDFRNDFFGMLRSWHNARANPMKKIWKKTGSYSRDLNRTLSLYRSTARVTF